MLTSQTKNTITVILEADQIAQMTFCFLTDTYLLKASRPPDSDLQLCDQGLNYRLKINRPFREFFIDGL